MKRYTVKDVVKLKHKEDYLKKLPKQEDFMFLPLGYIFGAGAIMSSMYFTDENRPLWTLIIGGIMSLGAIGESINYGTADFRIKKIIEKYNEIYDTMGKDFMKEAEMEYWKQFYIESEKKNNKKR